MTVATVSQASLAIPESDPLFYDINNLAKKFGFSPLHVRRLADRGAMPRPVKFGRLIRWNVRTIKEWMDAGCPSCKGPRR